MKKDEIILKAKKFVAEEHGYSDEVLGSAWEYAMQLTHRRKMQITMYEDLCNILADTIIMQNEKDTK